MKALESYVELCFFADRQPDSTEFMAWSILGVEPQWFLEMVA